MAQTEPSLEHSESRLKLSRDPNKAMLEMMTTIDALRTVLSEENSLLKNADTNGFMQLQDKKLDVAKNYLDGMAQLLARKEELKTADEAIKNRMELQRNEFAEVAYDNHAHLNRMKNGMKRLSDKIMEAARDTATKNKQYVYGANGQLQTSRSGTIGISESA